MSINSREDANKYYQVVNKLVDEYIDKWKIKPSRTQILVIKKPIADFNKSPIQNSKRQ